MGLTQGHLRLREWMKRTGATQAEVARRASRSEPAVSLWFSEGSRPDADARLALRDIVPIEDWARPVKRKLM